MLNLARAREQGDFRIFPSQINLQSLSVCADDCSTLVSTLTLTKLAEEAMGELRCTVIFYHNIYQLQSNEVTTSLISEFFSRNLFDGVFKSAIYFQ